LNIAWLFFIAANCKLATANSSMNIQSAEALALQLFTTHGLRGWSFKFDRARLRFGCCNFTTKTISLSKALTELNHPAKVRDTLLHEIAHALVGKRKAHGKEWQSKAKEIGCNPKRCYTHEEVVIPKGKYTASCRSCGKEFQALRKRRGVACRACCRKLNGGKYSTEFLIEFRENGATTRTIPHARDGLLRRSQ